MQDGLITAKFGNVRCPAGRLMIDATHLKAHRTAASLPAQKGAVSRGIGLTKGGLNSKLQVVCDGAGQPVALALTEGQRSDYQGAALQLDRLSKAKELLADRGYESDGFRAALNAKGLFLVLVASKSQASMNLNLLLYIGGDGRWTPCRERSRLVIFAYEADHLSVARMAGIDNAA